MEFVTIYSAVQCPLLIMSGLGSQELQS